jgi:hypothetical protein
MVHALIAAAALSVAGPAAAKFSVSLPPSPQDVRTVDFGTHDLGGPRVVREILVTNTGLTTIVVPAPVVADRIPNPIGTMPLSRPRPPGPFALDRETCSLGPLAPGASCRVWVALSPSLSSRPSPLAASDVSSLTIAPVGDMTRRISLVALVRHPVRLITAVSKPLRLGSVRPGRTSQRRSVSMVAYGSYEIVGGQIVLEGDALDQFEIVDNGCTGALLAPFSRCQFAVLFAPTAPGVKQAVVRVRGPGDALPRTDLEVRGTGLPTMTTTMRTLARRGGHYISGGKIARLLAKRRFSLGVHNWPAAGVVRASLTLLGGPGGSTRLLATSRPTRVTGTGAEPVFVRTRPRALRALRAVGARPKVILRFQLTERDGAKAVGRHRVRVSVPPMPR